MHRSCSTSRREAEHYKNRAAVTLTHCVAMWECVTVTEGDECESQTELSAKVRFGSSSHTLDAVNDLPRDNCTNKPCWPRMPVSVGGRRPERRLAPPRVFAEDRRSLPARAARNVSWTYSACTCSHT